MLERIPLLAGLTLLALAVALGSVFIADGIRDRNRADVNHGNGLGEEADRVQKDVTAVVNVTFSLG